MRDFVILVGFIMLSTGSIIMAAGTATWDQAFITREYVKAEQSGVLIDRAFVVPARGYKTFYVSLEPGDRISSGFLVLGNGDVSFYVMNSGNFSRWEVGKESLTYVAEPKIAQYVVEWIAPKSDGYYIIFDNSYNPREMKKINYTMIATWAEDGYRYVTKYRTVVHTHVKDGATILVIGGVVVALGLVLRKPCQSNLEFAQTKQFYDKVYRLSKKRRLVPLEALPTKNFALKKVGSGRLIHSLGCGEGVVEYYFSEASNTIVGIDISINAIKSARELHEDQKSTFVLASATHLPFRDSTFQVVLAFDILEHLVEPRLALRESKRVLTYHGEIYASVPNVDGVFSRIARHLGKSIDEVPEHIQFFTKDSLEGLFRRTCFRTVEIHGFGIINPRFLMVFSEGCFVRRGIARAIGLNPVSLDMESSRGLLRKVNDFLGTLTPKLSKELLIKAVKETRGANISTFQRRYKPSVV